MEAREKQFAEYVENAPKQGSDVMFTIVPRGASGAAGGETARSGRNVDMSRAPPAYKGGQHS